MCDTVPHFTGIAKFTRSYPKQIENIFSQILLICHEEGLIGNELFALDGCKLSSNAAKEHSGTLNELKEKRDKIQLHIQRCINRQTELDNTTFDEERYKRLEKPLRH